MPKLDILWTLLVAIFSFLALMAEPLLAFGMYLLWGKIPLFFWWLLFVAFLIMYFGRKTYNQAVFDKEEPGVIRFWYVARTIIFIIEVVAVVCVYGFVIYGALGHRVSQYPASKEVVVTPDPYSSDRKNFANSILILRESSDLTQPPEGSNGPFTLSPAQEAKVKSDAEQGIAMSKNVSDAFLDSLDPDLKKYYRDELIGSETMYLQGLKDGDNGNTNLGVQEQVTSGQLLTKWITWWETNSQSISEKVYPRSN